MFVLLCFNININSFNYACYHTLYALANIYMGGCTYMYTHYIKNKIPRVFS